VTSPRSSPTASAGCAPYHNRELTGDPARSWVADLATRRPFRDVAVLTCDDARWDREWLERDPDAHLQVYELSPHVTRRVARQLGPLARRVRFEHVDLNFAELPVERYDLIWSSGGFHCLLNLEHVLNQVAGALRPGGIFVLHGWVGERRMQFDAARLARANALLAEIPARYRRVERITPAPPWALSPFRGVRSNEILPLVHDRFDVVHERLTGRVYPLAMVVDLDAIERDDPALLERVLGVEAAARDDATLRPGVVYGVYRRRVGHSPLTSRPRRQ